MASCARGVRSEKRTGPGQEVERRRAPAFRTGASPEKGCHFRLNTRRTVSTACMVYSGLAASWKRFFMKDMGS